MQSVCLWSVTPSGGWSTQLMQQTCQMLGAGGHRGGVWCPRPDRMQFPGRQNWHRTCMNAASGIRFAKPQRRLSGYCKSRSNF